jgi:hypothetical protein
VSLVHVLAIVAMRSYGSGRRGDSFRAPTVAGTRNVPTSGAPLEHAHRRRCASVPLVSSVSPRSATLRGLDDPVRLPRCDGRMCCLLLHRDRHDEALRAPRLIGPSACRLLRSRSASTAARAAGSRPRRPTSRARLASSCSSGSRTSPRRRRRRTGSRWSTFRSDSPTGAAPATARPGSSSGRGEPAACSRLRRARHSPGPTARRYGG